LNLVAKKVPSLIHIPKSPRPLIPFPKKNTSCAAPSNTITSTSAAIADGSTSSLGVQYCVSVGMVIFK
jgi:hypothetical protein